MFNGQWSLTFAGNWERAEVKTQLPKAAYSLTGAAGRHVCCRSNYRVGGRRDREAQGLSLNLLPSTNPCNLTDGTPLCKCSRASLLLPTAQASPTSTWIWLWISRSPGLWRKEEEVQNPGNWPWEAPESPAHHLRSVMGGWLCFPASKSGQEV